MTEDMEKLFVFLQHKLYTYMQGRNKIYQTKTMTHMHEKHSVKRKHQHNLDQFDMQFKSM